MSKLMNHEKKPEFLEKMNFIHPQDKTISVTNFDGFVLPGVIDIHFHGAFGWDFSFGDVEKLKQMLDKVFQQGITGIFPTLITCSEEQRLRALKDIAQIIKTRKEPPIIHGIYLEGPFLASEKRGSHPDEHLRSPDFALLQKWQEAAEGNIKLITVAPELPGAVEFIKQASESGVTCAIGHSNANAQQTKLAIEAGARHVTHLFNAMPNFHHRKPNLLSCILTQKGLSIELIGDGVHVSTDIIKFAYSIFENDQVIITSDCVATTGLPDGNYQLYNNSLIKSNDTCCLENGNLFGGSSTLTASLKKLGSEAGIAWGLLGTSVWRNPCRLLNISPPDTEVYFDPEFNWVATKSENNWYWNGEND